MKQSARKRSEVRMARAGYCKHGTYIGHNSVCWQCAKEKLEMKKLEEWEWNDFKRKVKQAMKEIEDEEHK